MVEYALLLLVIASWCYWLVAFWMTRSFFTRRSESISIFLPPVSILKPVCGLDYQSYENFASYCQQDYPEFELLFGVSDDNDPAIPIIERLQRDFPACPIRLIVAPISGENHKVSTLQQLAEQARYEVLVINDSDTQVSPDYLSRVVAPLADASVGLVTCTYRGIYPQTLAAQFQALHMGVLFLPSVIVARKVIAMRFALGATVALRKSHLAQIGGFAALAGYLADDHELGARIAALGLGVQLSDYVVPIALGETSFAELWDREVRWARCSRISRPLEYPGLLICFSTALAIVYGIYSGNLIVPLGVTLTLRWGSALWITYFTRDLESRRSLLWLPLRDLLSALIWCVGGLGKRVVWRDQTYLVQSDGRMVATQPAHPFWDWTGTGRTN